MHEILTRSFWLSEFRSLFLILNFPDTSVFLQFSQFHFYFYLNGVHVFVQYFYYPVIRRHPSVEMAPPCPRR